MRVTQVNMHEAKSRLSELAELVQQGETVIIAKAGKPYLDLLPHRDRRITGRAGRLAGRIRIAEAFDYTPAEAIEGFVRALVRCVLLGKLDAPDDPGSIVEEEGFSPLAITFFHGERAGALAPLHLDPFDRMLIAQAQAEGLELITADASLAECGVRTINALR